MIVGVGVDVVDLQRFAASIARTPALLSRLFADSERVRPDGRELAPHSLAARFAAKEALLKAVGGSERLRWRDMRVGADAEGAPVFDLAPAAADVVASRGIGRVHLSMSHDGGVAVAYVVAES